MVTDVWISQDGIADTKLHWYMGRSHITDGEDEESNVQDDTVKEKPDIDILLSFDWSSEDVLLLDYDLWPDDSGHGWQFFLADINFDRKPYMNVSLLDAYVNENKEYRYLSLDCSSHGGDMRGGAYTVVLYETVLGEDIAPKEIARII